MAERKSRTLFVRNLAYSTTNETLANVFEDVGPIKTSFVVSDKDSGKCKGFGYVQYSMLEDATKAIETITHCEGRKISISFADAKKKLVKKAKHFGAPSDISIEEQEEAEAVPEANKKKIEKPTPEVKEKKAKPFDPTREKSTKRCRLIVRNLSFKCKEADLKASFKKYGDISEINIPLKNDRSRGFGFVEFTQVQSAHKAVAEMNSKGILGRAVAVDWAIAKDRFEAGKQKEPDRDSGVSESEEEEKVATKPKGKAGKAKVKQEVESESEEEEESEEENVNDSDKDAEEESDEESDGEDEEDDDDSSEGEESQSESEEEEPKPKPVKKPAVERKNDVEEGRTLFIRNIPFEVEEEELAELFEEFGELAYTRMVMDRNTGRPRGTAFIQFRKKSDAVECLEKAQDNSKDGGLSMQGRRLNVVLAISKTEAQKQEVDKKTKDEKDSRNLFLAREGLIREGTQAAIGISTEDMKKRRKVEATKREKLKNQNVFVSSTRLSMHNLPPQVDEKQLRTEIKKAVDEPAARITECRIMRDLNRKNQEGVAKSLGYAFVNFTHHEHALKALKTFNNSTVFGDTKRPIVEFSLENKKALEAKENRKVKSKALAEKRKAEKAEGDSGGKGEATKPANRPRPAAPAKPKVDKSQDRVAKAMHTGPKGMPKRMGPKIRHRNRGKGENPAVLEQRKKKKDKQQFHHRQWQKQKEPVRMKKNKKKGEIRDKTDSLIQKHKAKKAKM